MPSITSRTDTDVLRGLIGDVDVELTLHREENVDPVERIDAQLLEGAVGGDLLLGEMLRRGDDCSDSFGQFVVGHKISVTFSK